MQQGSHQPTSLLPLALASASKCSSYLIGDQRQYGNTFEKSSKQTLHELHLPTVIPTLYYRKSRLAHLAQAESLFLH